PLAESNPVPQDPISAIHPLCIYTGAVASAMGFGLCRSKMMNGIVVLHSPPMPKRMEGSFALLDASNPIDQASSLPSNSNVWAQKAVLLYCYVAIEACLCCFGGVSPSLRSRQER
ncbi:hypothetical protein Tco_0287605, partial [Tanacetum coccineum]